MKSPARTLAASLCLSASLVASSYADKLDDLLDPTKDDTKLVDDSATAAWQGVVDAFRRNDLAKARELGQAFLKANHKTSPYQLLGVQVMLDLANADNPTVTRDVTLSVEMQRLMVERDNLRAKYAAQQRIADEAEATIVRITRNRTQPVQAGTNAYWECTRADERIRQANAEMAAMKPDIEANKTKVNRLVVAANVNLKSDTLKLLDMLVEAGEIEAAFAITNVFLRVAGSDLEIAQKQQQVIRIRDDRRKADEIVTAITTEIGPLAAGAVSAEAQPRLNAMIAKLEASTQSDSVKKLAFDKLAILGYKSTAPGSRANGGTTASPQEAAEIAGRIAELETKLEHAQEYFGTVVRSIEGCAEFTSTSLSGPECDRWVSVLKEKVTSGVIAKSKLDNLIKAKSEHAGILSELDILTSDPAKLSLVQKGRLANLRTTAQTATDLLRKASL